MWGLVVLCGFDLPPRFLRLGYCMVAGGCMQRLLRQARDRVPDIEDRTRGRGLVQWEAEACGRNQASC
jgi:hypothetical protein